MADYRRAMQNYYNAAPPDHGRDTRTQPVFTDYNPTPQIDQHAARFDYDVAYNAWDKNRLSQPEMAAPDHALPGPREVGRPELSEYDTYLPYISDINEYGVTGKYGELYQAPEAPTPGSFASQQEFDQAQTLYRQAYREHLKDKARLEAGGPGKKFTAGLAGLGGIAFGPVGAVAGGVIGGGLTNLDEDSDAFWSGLGDGLKTGVKTAGTMKLGGQIGEAFSGADTGAMVAADGARETALAGSQAGAWSSAPGTASMVAADTARETALADSSAGAWEPGANLAAGNQVTISEMDAARESALANSDAGAWQPNGLRDLAENINRLRKLIPEGQQQGQGFQISGQPSYQSFMPRDKKEQQRAELMKLIPMLDIRI